jgi:hypothetical protein
MKRPNEILLEEEAMTTMVDENRPNQESSNAGN